MAEAFLTARIGETRAAVTAGGQLVEMHLERFSDGARPGTRAAVRLGPGGTARLAGEPLRLIRLPPGAAEGALVEVEIVRAAIPERHRRKPARARVLGPAAREGQTAAAPGLAEMLRARGIAVRAGWPEPIAEAWAAAWQEAELGEIRLPGGRVSLVPTPAGTAVDIDGEGPLLPLCLAAADALGAAIRRFGIGGSVIVDLPALDRAGRASTAARLDAALAGLACERTAINGFGLVQLVRPRTGPSILERAWFARAETIALDLLEAAVRDPRPGPLRIVAPAAAAAVLARHPALIAEATRAAGRPIDVTALPAAGAGHVEPA